MRAQVLCGLLALLIVSPSVTRAAPVPFPDTQKSWYRYRESIEYLRQKGAIGGYPDGTFKPKATINRAEFLKLVFRARGPSEPVSGDCFLDVPADAWFAPFVCAAERRGIIQGYPSGTGSVFKPEQPVVFAEAIKMTLKAYGRDVSEAPGERWYANYAAALDRDHILPAHSYLPWDTVNRERAAELIARFIQFDEERKIGNLSPGCGRAQRDAPSSVNVNGIQRNFLLTIPRGYREHNPSPLIVAFHGRTNDNARVRSYFRLDREADDSFIAYPSAIKQPNGTFTWSDGGDKASELRDFAFFDALVEELALQYCIDMDRIFVAGHSLGAWFANSVACARGGVVRASGTVGGSATMRDCSGPSAALMINNPKDASSPHAASEAMRDIRVGENGCTLQTESAEPSAFSCRSYRSCYEGNTVTFCPHTIDHERNGSYYPHLWPDGTAQAIVRFFEALQ